MLIKLSAPYTFEGKTSSEVEVAIEAMTGQDLIEIQRRFRRVAPKKNTTALNSLIITATDTDFQLFVLSDLTGLPIEFFTGLPVCDMMRLCSEINGFFLKDSE